MDSLESIMPAITFEWKISINLSSSKSSTFFLYIFPAIFNKASKPLPCSKAADIAFNLPSLEVISACAKTQLLPIWSETAFNFSCLRPQIVTFAP